MDLPFVPVPKNTHGEDIPSAEWLNEHAGGRLIAVAAIFMVISILFIGLRFWSRRLKGRETGWDDYLIYPALFACWLSQATCIAIVFKGGVGTRAAYWEISGQEEMIEEWAKYIYVVEMCYLLAACLTKLALLSIFLRILRDTVSRRVTQLMIGITIAGFTAEVIACSLQCIPFDYQWDKTIEGGHCFNQIAFYEYLSIPNILTDVVLFILPLPTVWKLHASRRQKVQLTIAFLTGSFGIIASILRFANFFITDPLADPTFNSVILLTWTVIEPGMYLVSACLPTLRPLLNSLLEKCGLRGQTINESAGSRPAEPLRHQPVVGNATHFQGIDDAEKAIGPKSSTDGTNASSIYNEPAPQAGQIVLRQDFEVSHSTRGRAL